MLEDSSDITVVSKIDPSCSPLIDINWSKLSKEKGTLNLVSCVLESYTTFVAAVSLRLSILGILPSELSVHQLSDFYSRKFYYLGYHHPQQISYYELRIRQMPSSYQVSTQVHVVIIQMLVDPLPQSLGSI